jgi:hypothetical protein
MKYCLILLLVAIGVTLSAQEITLPLKSGSLELSYGFNQVKEENLHPKVHSGTTTTFSYGRDFKSRNISELEIILDYSRVKTIDEDWAKTVNGKLSAKYRYLFKTWSSPKFMYAAGPEVFVCYNVDFYPNWDESHLYWANQLSLGMGNRLSCTLDESNSLKLDLGFSLLSVLSRPVNDRQYKIDDTSFGGIVTSLHSNPEAGSIGKALYLVCKAEYQFHANKKVAKAFYYSFDYGKADGKNSSIFKNTSYRLGFKIYF